jgi:hypothetical protein
MGKISFEIELFLCNQPTESGSIYPANTLEELATAINAAAPKIIVQELMQKQRESEKIPLHKPWPKYAMGDVKNARFDGSVLYVTIETRNTAKGKTLSDLKDQNIIEFVPVGTGKMGSNKNVNNYVLQYIAVIPQ